MKSYAVRTKTEMEDVLMKPGSDGPEIHYHMIRGGSDKSNITIWETGTIDGEYIKSYGHYHVGEIEETYNILQGQGIIILQGKIVDDNIETFKAMRVKAGDKIHIPKNMGHLAINTGKIWLVTSDNSPVNFNEENPISAPGHTDYEPFKKMHGAAYYVVEKNGEPELVKNPHYRNVPEAKID